MSLANADIASEAAGVTPGVGGTSSVGDTCDGGTEATAAMIKGVRNFIADFLT